MSNPIRPIYRTNENIVACVIVSGLLLVMVPMFVFGHSAPSKAANGVLLAFPFMFVVFGVVALRARVLAKRMAACRSSRGRVTEILDGSLVAAAHIDTDIPSEAFVARFALVAEDGSCIVVEPGPTHLIDLAEIHVGDEIQIQGPHTTRGQGTYRGTEPTLVYRGTKACPLALSRPVKKDPDDPAFPPQLAPPHADEPA